MKQIIRKLSRVIPDSLYIRMMYYKHFRLLPNLKNPQTYNEKIQWIKLNDRKPEYTIMADKYSMKQYVTDKIGGEYVVPLLAVWDNAEDINIDPLPNQFVLKCSNGHGVIICKDKESFDLEAAKSSMRKQLRNNLYWYGREWAYKNSKSRVIAEQYIEDDTEGLIDYKVMCFNGKAQFVKIVSTKGSDFGRSADSKAIYELPWGKTDIFQGDDISKSTIEKPSFLDEMLLLSEIFAKNTLLLRVDWYYVQGQLYLGEFTFYDMSGFGKFGNPNDDICLGSRIKLPNI